MATRIIEYSGLWQTWPIVPAHNKVASQTALTATGTSAASSAFNDMTEMVCVQSDEAIKVAFGATPTATDNDYKIVAGGEQFFLIQAGSSWKVAIKT